MFHENSYKPSQYTPVVKARQLCDYEFTITDNKNKFPEYEETEKKDSNGNVIQTVITLRQDAIINRIRQESFDIYTLAFTANVIDLRKEPERKEERFRKQSEAISLCDVHLATMELCCLKYGASKKRLAHWGSSIIEVREALKKWHKSDIERYASI